MKLESAATESSRGVYFKGMFHRPGVPIRAILFPGPWAMSGDSCCDSDSGKGALGMGGGRGVKARDPVKHPTGHRMVPTTENEPVKKANSAKGGKPCHRPMRTHSEMPFRWQEANDLSFKKEQPPSDELRHRSCAVSHVSQGVHMGQGCPPSTT